MSESAEKEEQEAPDDDGGGADADEEAPDDGGGDADVQEEAPDDDGGDADVQEEVRFDIICLACLLRLLCFLSVVRIPSIYSLITWAVRMQQFHICLL